MLRLSRLARYGAGLSSHDLLKLVAVALMSIDHIGAYLYPDALWLRVIGRASFPLFFFLAGYAPASRWRWDIIWVALAVELVAVLTYHPLFPLNALFGFIIARLVVLRYHEVIVREPLMCWLLCLVFLTPTVLLWEYGTQACLFAIYGYLVRVQREQYTTLIFACLTIATYPLLQLLGFDFSLPQLIAVYVLIIGAGIAMWYFKPHVFTLRDSAAMRTMLVLSRYSLYYYALHLALLMILAAYVLHTQAPQAFRLINW